MKIQRNGITYVRARDTDDVFLPVIAISADKGSYFGRVAALLVVAVLCSSTSAMAYGAGGDTLAYFRDAENSSANVFRAGLLGFEVESVGDAFSFGAPEDTEDGYHTALLVPESGSIPMQYKITVEKTAGSDAFCGALHALATSTVFAYDGPLMALSTTTTEQGPFDFKVSLAGTDGLVDGDICDIDIVYFGWSSALPSPFGYTDMHRVPLSFVYSSPAPIIEPAAFRAVEALSETEGLSDAPTEVPQETPEEPIPAEENTVVEPTEVAPAETVPPAETTPEAAQTTPEPAPVETVQDVPAEPEAPPVQEAVEAPPVPAPETAQSPEPQAVQE